MVLSVLGIIIAVPDLERVYCLTEPLTLSGS